VNKAGGDRESTLKHFDLLKLDKGYLQLRLIGELKKEQKSAK